jgi:hypothetical protein
LKPHRGEAGESLTGIWHGRYFYPLGLPPVDFEAILLEGGHTLTGTVTEPSMLQDGSVAEATLSGTRQGSDVSFTKLYANTGLYKHPVKYTGTLNPDATELEGRWRISWYWSGRFFMIRARSEEASVSRRIAEEV